MKSKAILTSLLAVTVIATASLGPCAIYAEPLSSEEINSQNVIANEENATIENTVEDSDGVKIDGSEKDDPTIKDISNTEEQTSDSSGSGNSEEKAITEYTPDIDTIQKPGSATIETPELGEASAPIEDSTVENDSTKEVNPDSDAVPEPALGEKQRQEEKSSSGEEPGQEYLPSSENGEKQNQTKNATSEDPVAGNENSESTETESSVQQEAVVTSPALSRNATPDDLPDLEMNLHYRFWQIKRVFLFARHYINVQESKEDHAKIVGTVQRADVLFLLKDEGDGWYYIESGKIRGFVRENDVYKGVQAEKLASIISRRASMEKDEEKKDEDQESFDWFEKAGTAIVDPVENKAFTYYRATVNPVIVEKKYAVPVVDDYLNIRAGRGTDNEVVGHIEKGGLLYVLEDEQNGWTYVESGLVRGFVTTRFIDMSNAIQNQVEERGAVRYKHAALDIQPENNPAFYYMTASVKSGLDDNENTGPAVVDFASRFIGNPYVWGGTSLTSGADCSGFVQSIYAIFGVRLPRVAEEQAYAGQAVPLDQAREGDLVFYQDVSGHIYHVMIYAGNGRTVEAQNSATGIVNGLFNSANALAWAVRVLKPSVNTEILEDALTITPSQTCGGLYTYERWDTDWIEGTRQKALFERYESYDEEGFGRIDGRYVIACTTTFGQVGDQIDFELDDGTVIKTIMGDAKNQNDEGCNEYGHLSGNNVIEFMVNGNLWAGHINPGNPTCHPEWGGRKVVRAVNYGNVMI